MALTLGPTATTSAQARRLDICAVAGMRMPPDDLRSPSAAPVVTSTRSFNMLMASLSSGSDDGAASGSDTPSTLPSTPRDRRLHPAGPLPDRRRAHPGRRPGRAGG